MPGWGSSSGMATEPPWPPAARVETAGASGGGISRNEEGVGG